MKVGDMVIINVPPIGEKHFPACHGIVIDKQERKELSSLIDNHCRIWWYILRSDTGKIEKFHENWTREL